MKERFRNEWRLLVTATRSLDKQTVVVLLLSFVFVVLQTTFGKPSLFHTHFAGFFAEEWQGVLSWGWWFVIQGVTGGGQEIGDHLPTAPGCLVKVTLPVAPPTVCRETHIVELYLIEAHPCRPDPR